MTESYIIPEFDENGNFLSDDVKARIVEMIESHIIPEFDENGNFLRDDVKARIVEMIEAHAPAPAPAPSNPGPEVITLEEGHPNLEGTLAEPLPDDLPVGSYLVNAPRFMGYRLSQKTPFGWDPKDFKTEINYYLPDPPEGELRAEVRRGREPIEGVVFSGTVTSTADSLHTSFTISNTSFVKGEVVKVYLESPPYELASRNTTAVSHEFYRSGTESEGVTHFLQTSWGSVVVRGKRIQAFIVDILVGSDRDRLSIDATFGLKSAPDVRETDGTYVPPSERVEVEVPEPTYVVASDYMSCTVTIPEVEGVVWHATFKSFEPSEDIVEPGVYQVQKADHQRFSVYASSEKGYYIKNNGGYEVPWETTVRWDYSIGLPITVPMPEPLNATTEDGVEGWIVRYPEVEHARYYTVEGWNDQGPIKKVITGDVFTPIYEEIGAEADPPYYVTNEYLGRLEADGTFVDPYSGGF